MPLSAMLTYKAFGARTIRHLSLSSIHRKCCTHPSIAQTVLRWIHRTSHQILANEDLSWQGNESFFRFTRGRFVCNEEFEMSQRYVHFNMDKLAQIAASTVDSRCCVAIEKYPDGQYSKAFLMTMEDGKQVVAKVPNPNAGQSQLTTASEVATMEFARDILDTPVPKVYAWSSEAQSNAVGAEYIIMQKAPGVQLERVWTKMKLDDRLELLKQILRYQQKWTSASFKQFGSLYFAQDAKKQNSQAPLYFDEHGTAIESQKFAVGPSTGREYYDAGRASINYDRGPWDSVEDYLTAIGNREITCVKEIPRLPKSPITLRGPGTYMTCREKKLRALASYLTIANYLVPVDRSIASSCLWHPDLHQENIFVDPKNPSEIVAIIDWQSTELAPLFNQCRKPYFLDYEGPSTQGLERPVFPENLDQLDEASQKKAKSLYLCQVLTVMYRMLLRNEAPLLLRTWEYQQTASFELLLIAQRLFIDGEAQYLASILALEDAWLDLPGVAAQGSPPYPFHFSSAERTKIEADAKGAADGMNLMFSVRDSIGRHLFPEGGLVRVDQYDEAKDALQQMKAQILDMYAHDDHERKLWEEDWPFDD